ncbi:MAG: caspase family protein, partial [Thermoguttaceae bacterium]|nr:caspase family protein [Thermoguttaceae bacterium]
MLSLSALLGRDGLWARPSIFFLGALALSLSASTVAPASAQDESSDPARAMAVVAKDGVKRAFLVGVDDYAEFDALKYASSDVEAIRAKLFELGFEPANVVELTSKSEARLLPTQRNIERQLETFLATAGPNDVLFLYFAGRGFQTGGVARFAPLDAEATDDEGGVDAETTISIANLAERLSRLKSKSKWLILDVSRENSTGTQSGAANAGALKKLVSPSGVLVLQSCSEGERLYGNVETERGLFTELLLEAFDGDADANDDGRISAREVCAYVSKQTSAESQARFNAPQTPRFSDDFADFIVAENLRQSGLTRDAWARAEALYAESHELAMAEKFDEAKARIADAIKIVANATDETAKKRYLDRQKEIELLASTVGDEATRSDVCVVSNAAELFDAVTNAADGAVVKLKDGTYKMTAELAPRRSLTFVGESGDREKVQLVFPGAAVTANSGVELAFENLTLTAERAVAINMLQDSAVKATQCNIVASQNPAVYGLGRCFLKDCNVRGRERITVNDLMRMNQNLTLYPIGVLVLSGGSLTAENCDIAPGVLIGPKAQASSLKKCALHRNAKAPINVNEVRSA